MFEGQEKWFMFSFISLFVGFFIFSVLRMMNIPLTTFEGSIWLVIGIGIVVSMGYVSVYERLKHQTEADEVEIYCDGIVRRGLITRDEFMLGVIHMREISIDWEDETLKKFEGSKLFDKIKQEFLRREAVEDFHARRKLKFSKEDLMRTNKKGEIKPKKTKTDLEKDLTYNALVDTQKRLESLKDHPETRNELELPFVKMDLTKLKIDKTKLQSYRYYFVLLKDEEHFSDQTIGFDRAFFILPGEKEKILEGHKRKVYDDGTYPIYVKSVYVHWNCLTFVLDNIPVLLLTYSENFDEQQTKEVITAGGIGYIQVQALIHLLNAKRGEDSQRELKTKWLEESNQKLTQTYHLLVQDIRKKKHQLVGNTGDEDEIKRLEDKVLKNKTINIMAVAVIIVLVFVLFFLIFAIVPSSSAQAPSAPPESANLIKNIFELFIKNKTEVNQ